MRTRFAVLGPVRAWRGDTELALGPPKQRALLALLLTEAGHPVAVHEIVDALWGQDPPDSAVNVVQRHVGALRRLLEPELPAGGQSRWLLRGSGGYRLEVAPDDLDLLRFRALRQRAAQDGQPPTATGLLIEALALWRGPAASGIAPEVRSHPAFTALDGEHLAAVKEIITLCGRLPLALAVVSARAVVNPAFPLASIAAELSDSEDSLDAFAGEAPAADARSAFSWSYQLLSPDAARVFRLFALHPGPDCSLAAVASLAGQRVGQVRPVMGELARAHLISEALPGRYGCHELLRAYAAELARTQDTAQELEAARRRLLDHYLHSAHAADSLLMPSRDRVQLRPQTAGVTVPRLPDRAAAAEWLETNRSAVLAAIEQDARHGGGEHSWQLASVLELHLDRGGRWPEQLDVQTTAVEAAQRLGDIPGQAFAHLALGFVSGRLDRPDEADAHLSRALELFGETGDLAGRSRTLRRLAFLANGRGRHEDALDHYAEASALCRAAGRRNDEAGIANEVGWTYILMGKYEDALTECGLAVSAHRETGDRNGEAAALDSLGYAHHHLNDHERALDCYEQALRLYREIRDRYLEADTLVHIGDTHRAAHQDTRAALAWREALGILDEIGHPDAEQVRHRLNGLDEPERPPRQ